MIQHETERRVAVLVSIAEPLLQAGVRACLANEADMEVIDANPVSAHKSVDVVVADSSTAAQIAHDGWLEREQGVRTARILVVTGEAREHAVRSGLEQGIHGFVLTSSPVSELLSGVRALFRGGKYLCAPVVHRLAQVAGRDILTSREDEVLQLLARGLCNKSIARDLDIAVGTVKTHVKAIMSKLNARSRTEAASIATQRGLVEVPHASLRHEKPHAYRSFFACKGSGDKCSAAAGAKSLSALSN